MVLERSTSASYIYSHRHSEHPDSDCYGPGHGDAHKHTIAHPTDIYEHSHIDPDCERYKYPYANGDRNRNARHRGMPSTARD